MLDVLEVRYNIPAAKLESRYTLRQIELKYHFLGRDMHRSREKDRETMKIAVLQAVHIAFGGTT
jgi:hypothetical protein